MIWLGAGITPATIAQSAFTPGNIVIYRVGDGSSALSATARPVFLDEYTTTGTLVQSVPMPTSVSGANRALTAQGTAFMGWITRSTNREYLAVVGFNATPGTSVSLSNAATINRVVGLIRYDGTINTTTALSDYASAGQPMAAITNDGTNIWATGSTGGVRYTTAGTVGTTVQLATTPTNLRVPEINDGQLYVSLPAGGVATVGTGLPTTAGQTITILPGLPSSGGSPYQYVFMDMDAGVAGSDVLYIADATNGILKFSLVGGTWTANGSAGVGTDVYRGLTATRSGSTVTLYATRANSQLVSLVDASGYNGTLSGTPTLLATAATNTAFRGVALSPTIFNLPVKLLSITAQRNEKAVLVNWSTASETNFSHFEVERSEDGLHFTTLGKINGTPGNRVQSYQFTDKAIDNALRLGGTFYYRLKMVDMDGSFEHSKVVTVRFDIGFIELQSIYPNPFIGEIKIKLYMQKATDADIILMDALGRSVMRGIKKQLLKGENVITIPGLHRLGTGTYLLKIVTKESSKTIRLVK
ncbi:MAG TPA: T9SS type A sorting domain-containing protein [Chitinophagaceae bacterium]|nr:T9SS type A sorting domain-containing protein [Chitinophagaceae bacterium]